MSDTIMFLGGVTLPKYAKLRRRQPVNESTNETLDGTIYTDFFSRRREWIIEYPLLSESDGDLIQALWERQYTDGTYLEFQFTAKGIYAMCKMDISDQDVMHGGQWYDGIVITLREQNAIS